MFNLAEIKDTIKIEPSGFRKKKSQAITDEINRKYANKVKRKMRSKDDERRDRVMAKRKNRRQHPPAPAHGKIAAVIGCSSPRLTHPNISLIFI